MALPKKKTPKYPVYNQDTDGCVYDWILVQAALLKQEQAKLSIKSKLLSSETNNAPRG